MEKVVSQDAQPEQPDPVMPTRDEVLDFQKRMGIAADGIMGPQTRALWEKALGEPVSSSASSSTARTAPAPEKRRERPARRRGSRSLGRFGQIALFEVPDGGLSDLTSYDGIVLPVDQAGNAGQFLDGLKAVDSELGMMIDGIRSERLAGGLDKIAVIGLGSAGPLTVIAANGAVAGRRSAAALERLAGVTTQTLEIASEMRVRACCFPFLARVQVVGQQKRQREPSGLV